MASPEEVFLTALGVIVGALVTLWVLQVSLYKVQHLERTSTFDFATRQLERSARLVIRKPERLALKRFLTVDTFRENYRGSTASAESDGVSARCRQRPSLFAPTIRIQVCLKDLPGPSAELILLTKVEIPASEIFQKAGNRSPILVRTRSPESVEGNVANRTCKIEKRHDISSVRSYVEEFTQLPARSMSSLKVEIVEDGNRKDLSPSYLFVARAATLEDLRKNRKKLGQTDPFDLQVPVDLAKDTTVIILSYEK